jgi:hypothetical protein
MNKIFVIIIVALISIVLLSCDSKVDKKNASTTPPKSIAPKPPAEPYSFKEFKLGMTIAEFYNLKPRVTYENAKKFETSLFIDTTIAGSGKQAYFHFGEYGTGLQQLSYISITIPKSDFSKVKDALISKYGSPTSTSNIVKSNAMGATFHGEKLIWNNGTSEITAESIGGKIDEADVNFSHLRLDQSKQDQEDSAKAKKDI